MWWYRVAIVVSGAVGNAALCWSSTSSFGTVATMFAFEMLPVVALAAAARMIGSRFVLVLAFVAHVAIIASAARVAIPGTSSTGPVALVLAPLVSLFVVVQGLYWRVGAPDCSAVHLDDGSPVEDRLKRTRA